MAVVKLSYGAIVMWFLTGLILGAEVTLRAEDYVKDHPHREVWPSVMTSDGKVHLCQPANREVDKDGITQWNCATDGKY